jgi:Phage-related minor tail protein
VAVLVFKGTNMAGKEINFILSVQSGDSVQQVQKFTLSIEEAGDTSAKAAKKIKASADATKQQAAASKEAASEIKFHGEMLTELDDVLDVATTSINDNTAATKKNTASQEEATAATEAKTSATEKETEATKEATQADVIAAENNQKLAASLKAAADAAELKAAREATAAKITERYAVASQEASMLQRTANREFGSTYTNLAKWESIGTPGILKTATWTLLGAGGIAYEGIKNYANFNKLMTQTITQAGQAPTSLPFLSKNALDIARQTGVRINDVADMMYRAASGTAAWNNGLGATKQQLVDVTRTVAQLNVLGNIPAGAASEQSARVLTALINANVRGIGNGPGAIKAAAELINAGVGAGDIRQSELVSALGRGVLTSAKANGMTAQDAISWIDLLTSLGTTGSVAGTYVKSGINLLTNPSTQGTKALGMLGIKPGEFQSIMSGRTSYNGQSGLMGVTEALRADLTRFKPFANYPKYKGAVGENAAINLLENWGINQIPQAMINSWKGGKLDAAQQQQVTSLILTKAFGGSKQFATIAALINNPDKLAGIMAAISRNDTAAVYNRDIRTSLNTPAARFHQLIQGINVDLITIGKTLTPWALKIGDALGSILGAFAHFKVLLLPLVGILGSVVALAITSKISGFVKGLYPLLGRGQELTNRFWGRIFGANSENRFYGKLTGGGQSWMKVQEAMQKEALAKLGKSAATFLNASVTMDEAANVIARSAGIEGTSSAMGGIGGGAVRAEQAAAAEEKRLLNLEQQKALLTQGRVVKTGDVKQALGIPLRSRNTPEILAETERLRGMQTATGAITQEGANMVTGLTTVAAEGAATEGIGALGGGLLGLAGGPIGMGLMLATTLPMVMPLLSRFFNGGSTLSGGANIFTGVGTTGFNPNTGRTNVNALSKQQSQAMRKFVSDLTSGNNVNADISSLEKLGVQKSFWQRYLVSSTGKAGLKTNVRAATALQNLINNFNSFAVQGKGLPNDVALVGGFGDTKFYEEFGGSSTTARIIINDFLKNNKDLINQLSPAQKQQLQKAIAAGYHYQFGNYKGIQGTLSALLGGEQSYLNSVYGTQLGKEAPGYLAQQTTGNQSTLIRNLSGINTNTGLGVTAALQGALHERNLASQDIAAARATKDPGAAKLYLSEAKDLTAAAENLVRDARSGAQRLNLHPDTITALANQLSNVMSTFYTSAGQKTASALAAAMVAALTSPVVATNPNSSSPNSNPSLKALQSALARNGTQFGQ